jgi:chemotaxis response regulator CheB
MRRSVVRLLASDPKIYLVGETGTYIQMMPLARKLHPQVVVMDLHMDDEKEPGPA